MANYDEFAHICSCTRELILAGLRIFIWPKLPGLPIRMFSTGKVTKRKHGLHIKCTRHNNQFSDRYLQDFAAVR